MSFPAIFLNRVACGVNPDPKTAALIQAIFNSTPKFNFNTTGTKIADQNAGLETLKELPPNSNYENKFVFLVDDLAVIDLVKEYPVQDTAFIGLVLIDERYQRKGLGTKIYTKLEQWINENLPNCKRIRLCVVESNPVIPFWEKMGFHLTGETKPHVVGEFKSMKLLMDKNL